MKKFLLSMILLGVVLLKVFGQEDLGAPYNEDDYGTLSTERNYPYYFLCTKTDSILIQCRRLNKKLFIFTESNTPKDISSYRNKPFYQLTWEEKEEIIINAWHNRDHRLINTIHMIAISDTSEEIKQVRKLSIMCLSVINNEETKAILLSLLKSTDRDIRMISALSLVQLGDTDIAFKYIEQFYDTYSVKNQMITALMIIKTPQSINLIKKFANDKDPSYALDASVALSLLGYCDLAFENIIKHKDSDIVFVRQMVAWCLAYYIGTTEAIKIAMSMKDDGNHFVRQDQEKIFKIYKPKL